MIMEINIYSKPPNPPFIVQVEWDELKNCSNPEEFPVVTERKGEIYFDEDHLQHPLFLFQPMEEIIKRTLEDRMLKKGKVDSIIIKTWKIVADAEKLKSWPKK